MKLQAGIKLLNEIVGYGDPVQDSDRFDAALKFYRNKGDSLEYGTILQDSIPYVVDVSQHWNLARFGGCFDGKERVYSPR